MNDTTNEALNPKKKSKAFPWAMVNLGAAIRMLFVGFGVATVSQILTGSNDGWRYWAVIAMAACMYAFGAVTEFAGEHALKKDKE